MWDASLELLGNKARVALLWTALSFFMLQEVYLSIATVDNRALQHSC
mgnify:FL=1